LLTTAAFIFLVVGCEKANQIEPKDQRLAIGAVTTSVCPDQDSSLQEGTTTMLATVYAVDGTLASNVPVNFSVDFAGAALNPARPLTNSNGRASTTLTSPRPPGDKLTVTAVLDAGPQASRSLLFPAAPYFVFGPLNPSPLVGADVAIGAGVTFACNISGLAAEISYDPSVLEYEPERVVELGVFNNVNADGVPSSTTLEVDSSTPGHFGFQYFRNDHRGVSVGGAYIHFTFRALKPGDAKLTVVWAKLSASVGSAYELYPTDQSSRITLGSLFVQKPAS
jgi:hypothetical protein